MDYTRPWLPQGADDLLGLDRQIIALLRSLELMPIGSLVGVFGPNDGGQEMFLRRAAWMMDEGKARLKLRNGNALFPQPIWYEPALASPLAHPLAGLVNTIMRNTSSTQSGLNSGTELINRLNRLHDVNSPSTMRPGSAAVMLRLGASFLELIEQSRGNHPGCLVVFVSGLEQLSPQRRWQLIDSGHVLHRLSTNLRLIFSLTPAGAREAARSFEPHASDERLDALIDQRLSLSMTINGIGVRRIGTLLRQHLAEAEPLLRSSFGQEVLSRLSLAVAHDSMGFPHFLGRLAMRVILMAEYVQELRVMQDLSEAQWAWVIISQRWPEMRHYMGTTRRWSEFRQTLQWLLREDADLREMVRSSLVQSLEQDPQLLRYIRHYADAFLQQSDALLRVEVLQRDTGL